MSQQAVYSPPGPSLPVPRVQLVQVGRYLAPRAQVETKIKAEIRDAMTEMYQGPAYDHNRYLSRRADLLPLEFSHTGNYHCCGNNPTCSFLESEWDGISRSLGIRVPMLFFRHPDCLDCPPACDCESLYDGEPCYHCRIKTKCGQWLWAIGVIRIITNDLGADDFKTQKTASVTFEGRLETPLRLVDYRYWWYGHRPVPDIMCETIEEYLTRRHTARRQFSTPCLLPDCCSRFRFWPRVLDCHCAAGDYDCVRAWDTDYIYTISQSCFNLWVPGHAEPRVIAISSAGTWPVTVRNSTGTHTYTYGTPNRIYTDTESAVALEYTGSWNLLPYATDVIRLQPGDNVIETGGQLQIGITPRYVN